MFTKKHLVTKLKIVNFYKGQARHYSIIASVASVITFAVIKLTMNFLIVDQNLD